MLRKKLLYPLFVVLSLGLFSTGCGNSDNPTIPGVQGPNVNQIDENILISAVLENVKIDLGVRVPIPKYNHSYVELSPDLNSNGTLVSISISAIDISDILNRGVDIFDPETLPGGRPIPGVLGGELPAVAFSIENVLNNMSFYIGNDIYGVFVPVNLELGGTVIPYRFKIGNRVVGNIAIVSNDQNGENGGFLLLLDIDNFVKRKIHKMARKARRRL